MEKWQLEKKALLSETKTYLRILADNKESIELITAILNIRDSAATANQSEWKQGEYWGWWKKIRPSMV